MEMRVCAFRYGGHLTYIRCHSRLVAARGARVEGVLRLLLLRVFSLCLRGLRGLRTRSYPEPCALLGDSGTAGGGRWQETLVTSWFWYPTDHERPILCHILTKVVA